MGAAAINALFSTSKPSQVFTLFSFNFLSLLPYLRALSHGCHCRSSSFPFFPGSPRATGPRVRLSPASIVSLSRSLPFSTDSGRRRSTTAASVHRSALPSSTPGRPAAGARVLQRCPIFLPLTRARPSHFRRSRLVPPTLAVPASEHARAPRVRVGACCSGRGCHARASARVPWPRVALRSFPFSLSCALPPPTTAAAVSLGQQFPPRRPRFSFPLFPLLKAKAPRFLGVHAAAPFPSSPIRATRAARCGRRRRFPLRVRVKPPPRWNQSSLRRRPRTSLIPRRPRCSAALPSASTAGPSGHSIPSPSDHSTPLLSRASAPQRHHLARARAPQPRVSTPWPPVPWCLLRRGRDRRPHAWMLASVASDWCLVLALRWRMKAGVR